MEIISGIIGALIGSLITAWLAIRQWKMQNQTDNTLKLFEEYHSKEMFSIRGNSWDFLRQHPGVRMSDMKSSKDINNALSDVSVLLHYFEKIYLLGEINHIDKKKAQRLLGHEFKFWHDQFFIQLANQEEKNSPWLSIFDSIQKLQLWLVKTTA